MLTGIVFVLKTGMAWDDLPPDLGLGCGRTCHDYLQKLQAAGVWEQLHTRLLSQLNQADCLDWNLGIVDSTSAKAPLGGPETGPSPTDRRKLGSKLHVLTDAQGIPVAVVLSGANTPDINRQLPLVVAVPPVGGKPGPARRRFDHVLGDRGYDSEPHRRFLRWMGIIPILGRRRTEHGSGLGILRWVIERTNSWLHSFGRLRRRLDKLPELQMAFAHLGCAFICWSFIRDPLACAAVPLTRAGTTLRFRRGRFSGTGAEGCCPRKRPNASEQRAPLPSSMLTNARAMRQAQSEGYGAGWRLP